MANPFYILIALIRAIILILGLVIFLVPYITITFFIENTPKRAFWVRRQYVRFAKIVLGISAEVTGEPHDSNALYVCNHRSFADPLVLAEYVNAFVVAKAEVSNLPLISRGAEMTGLIYVKREDKNSRTAVREKIIEVLLSGQNILIYPEGTVNEKLDPLPYKKGTFIEAAKQGIPVVPVVLEYKKEKDLWHNSGMIAHHFKQFGRLTTQCKLIIGPAMSDADGLVLCEKAEAWTREKILEIHKDWDSYFTPLLPVA